mgnify:CR=1 FL=1
MSSPKWVAPAGTAGADDDGFSGADTAITFTARRLWAPAAFMAERWPGMVAVDDILVSTSQMPLYIKTRRRQRCLPSQVERETAACSLSTRQLQLHVHAGRVTTWAVCTPAPKWPDPCPPNVPCAGARRPVPLPSSPTYAFYRYSPFHISSQFLAVYCPIPIKAVLMSRSSIRPLRL